MDDVTAALRCEVLELRALNRKHRAISEATESELRALRRQQQQLETLLTGLIISIPARDECRNCLKLLQQIQQGLLPPQE